MLTDILPRNENVDWKKEKFICSTPKLQDVACLWVVDPALGPNEGGPLGSRIVQDFEKRYGQNLTIICRAKGWVVDGCGNRGGHIRHAGYFDPNIEANRALVSGPCFTRGDVRVEGSKKCVAQWAHPDTERSEKLMKNSTTNRHMGGDPGIIV